jgi:hypothetical protein
MIAPTTPQRADAPAAATPARPVAAFPRTSYAA